MEKLVEKAKTKDDSATGEINLVDFTDLLKNKNIPWNEYTEDEFRLD